mmetsp:Transcript_19855/g.51997  ORF Transcript_19855/g.51997 Transcript_19855/m.51997 type:complete len:790 (+) Transcript_19855:96-2465(+)
MSAERHGPHQKHNPHTCRTSWQSRCAATAWDSGGAPIGAPAPGCVLSALLLAIHVDEVVRLLLLLATRCGTSSFGARGRGGRASVGIGGLADLHELVLEFLGDLLEEIDVRLGLGHLLLQGRQHGVDRCLEVGRHLVAEVGELLLGLVNERLTVVFGLNHILACLIRDSVGLGIGDHALDVRLVQRGRPGDGDGLLLASAAVLGRDVQDAVGINVEGHLDLRHAAGRGRHAIKAEGAEDFVILGELALTLENDDLHGGLRIHGRRKHLLLLRGDSGVPRDEDGSHAAKSLHTHRKRTDIEQDDILHIARENASLDRGTNSDDLVGVHTLVGLLAVDELLGERLDGRDPGGATDEHDLVDVRGAQLGILQGLLDGHAAALDQLARDLLELRARERLLDVLRPGRICSDEGERDLRLIDAGQLDLGLLRRLGEALQRLPVLEEFDALLRLELGGEPLHDDAIEVVASEVGVAVGGQHLADAVADLEHGDVEGAAAEVEDHDGLVVLLLQAVGEGGGGGLVHNAEDLQAGDLARVLGGLALGVVEVGRHRDHGLGDLGVEVLAGVGAELAQDLGGDLLGGEFLAGVGAIDHQLRAAGLHPVGNLLELLLDLVGLPADEALHRVEGVLRVHDGLALGDLADQQLAGLCVGDYAGGRARTLGVRDNGGGSGLHGSDGRIRGAEVDADDLLAGSDGPRGDTCSAPPALALPGDGGADSAQCEPTGAEADCARLLLGRRGRRGGGTAEGGAALGDNRGQRRRREGQGIGGRGGHGLRVARVWGSRAVTKQARSFSA